MRAYPSYTKDAVLDETPRAIRFLLGEDVRDRRARLRDLARIIHTQKPAELLKLLEDGQPAAAPEPADAGEARTPAERDLLAIANMAAVLGNPKAAKDARIRAAVMKFERLRTKGGARA